MMTDRYTYRVIWSADDGNHAGLCAEFPSLKWVAPAPEDALAGIRRVVREAVRAMEAAGEPLPEPANQSSSSS